MSRLRITEIFHSLQGETKTVGIPTVFIRLTGCPLRCQYCDSAYAFKGGEWRTFDDILSHVKSYDCKFVTVSGGEPLAQPDCVALLKRLCDEGFEVSLETSGALDISQVDTRVSRVVDLKTPGSKECDKNLWTNINELTPNDQVKFVICNREDYDWAKQCIVDHGLQARCPVLFSPSYEELAPAVLADWILSDKLGVRFQLQLHKVLWGDVPGK